MMKPLRKKHFQVWVAFAILLPAGILFAWLAIPNSEPVELLQSSDGDLLPVIKSTSDKTGYTVNLRTNNENSQWQLEWKSKTPLTVPSAIIYKTSPGRSINSFKIENAELIGRIEANRDYVFPLRPDSTGHKQLNLVLYDFIHQQILDSINLHL